jgi:glycosyltransferase involved in cell wall biosynthesis
MRAMRRFAWRHVVDQERLFLRLFAPALEHLRADVYTAHDLPLLPVALDAARRDGAKVVYDSHELFAEQEFSEAEKRMWRDVEARAIHACDAVMTINPSVAAELERRYGVARVHVIYNAERNPALPAVAGRFHREFSLPAQARVLLFQGGLSAGRNLEELVSAMRFVRTQDLHLVLMGDGALKAQLRTLAARSGAQRVHLKDAVPQADLLSWTASADAGVIPYQATCLNNYYCTPNKLFEFIAAGLPVLGSDLPEIRSIVMGNGIGEVADLSTEAKIAAAIDGFFADPARLDAWRAAAAVAREKVNWDVEGRKVVEIYEKLR